MQLGGIVTADYAAFFVVLVARVAVAQVFATAQRNVDLVAEQAPFVQAVQQAKARAIDVTVFVDAEMVFVVDIAVVAPCIVQKNSTLMVFSGALGLIQKHTMGYLCWSYHHFHSDQSFKLFKIASWLPRWRGNLLIYFFAPICYASF